MAVFNPDDVLVPIVMRERLAETEIERIMGTDADSRSDLEVHDVHAADLGGGWLRFQVIRSRRDNPAEQLDRSAIFTVDPL